MVATKLKCTGECIFVVNKKASRASSFNFACNYIIIGDEKGLPIDGARVNANEQLYSVLFYEKRHFISLVVKKPTPYAISLVFRNRADYDDVLALLEMTANKIRFSRQDFKVASYASRITDKLRDGVELAIMDAIDKSNVAVCPECGMEVPPGAEYCMECGAEL
nr:zinc ribbon domain-containing protein [uncultured Mogibacterium sp.]